MKYWIVAAATMVCAAALSDVTAQPPAVKAALVSKGWHADYQTARAEAKRTSKPLLVVFRCQP